MVPVLCKIEERPICVFGVWLLTLSCSSEFMSIYSHLHTPIGYWEGA